MMTRMLHHALVEIEAARQSENGVEQHQEHDEAHAVELHVLAPHLVVQPLRGFLELESVIIQLFSLVQQELDVLPALE